MSKDSNISETENNVLTPELVKEALENLPSNYVVVAHGRLKERFDKGEIKKAYSKNWIVKVKLGQGDAFNVDIMEVLVDLGLENLKVKRLYNRN